MCVIITAFEFENSSCEQNSVHSLLLAACAVEEKTVVNCSLQSRVQIIITYLYRIECN